MIRIGKAASGEQEALIWGRLPGEGSFCRQLSREKRDPLIKVLFVLIFSFAQGRHAEQERSCRRVGAMLFSKDWILLLLHPQYEATGGASTRRRRRPAHLWLYCHHAASVLVLKHFLHFWTISPPSLKPTGLSPRFILHSLSVSGTLGKLLVFFMKTVCGGCKWVHEGSESQSSRLERI